MAAIHDRTATVVHTVPLGWHAAAALTATMSNQKAGCPPGGDETGGEGLGALIRVFGMDDGLVWTPRPKGKIVEVTGPLHALDALALRMRVWVRSELTATDPRTERPRAEAAAFTLCIVGLFLNMTFDDADRMRRNGYRGR